MRRILAAAMALVISLMVAPAASASCSLAYTRLYDTDFFGGELGFVCLYDEDPDFGDGLGPFNNDNDKAESLRIYRPGTGVHVRVNLYEHDDYDGLLASYTMCSWEASPKSVNLPASVDNKVSSITVTAAGCA